MNDKRETRYICVIIRINEFGEKQFEEDSVQNLGLLVPWVIPGNTL